MKWVLGTVVALPVGLVKHTPPAGLSWQASKRLSTIGCVPLHIICSSNSSSSTHIYSYMKPGGVGKTGAILSLSPGASLNETMPGVLCPSRENGDGYIAEDRDKHDYILLTCKPSTGASPHLEKTTSYCWLAPAFHLHPPS
jgi:hypothetical protein